MALEPTELKIAFLEVARLAGVSLAAGDVDTEFLPAPHRRPSSLRSQAIYAFVLGDACLKVGKAGPKTQARFTSQHYGDRAPSTLAKSIIEEPDRMRGLVPREARSSFDALNIGSVGAWLEANTARFHLFISDAAPSCALSLAEAFLQCRLRPVYEGKGA